MGVMVGLMHGMNNGTGAEKEQRLEERMRHQVEHTGRVRAASHANEHVTQLRHGGVRQHLLDVPLAQRNRCREQRRERTNRRHNQ